MIILADKEKCTGCSSCAQTCPHGAISMLADVEGFLMPSIDSTKCVECHLCEKSCPVLNYKPEGNEVSPDAYAAWSLEDRTRSSSGGIFSAFARFVLAKGGVVFGAAFDERMHCRHIFVEDIDGLEPLRGSKYVQSDVADTFRQAKAFLKDGRMVLYCGTPCQIAGLKAYLKRGYENLLMLDLACHGVPSDAVFQAYIAKISTRFAGMTAVAGFEFRRRDRWGKAPSVSLGGKLTSLYGSDNLYMAAFDKGAMFRKSCYTCPYARLPRVGDCTIADFWGIGRHGVPFRQDTLKGVSLVLVNNAKGADCFGRLANVFVEKRTLREALVENHNLVAPSKPYEGREEVIRAFLNSDETLAETDRRLKLVDRSLKGKLKELALRYHLMDAAQVVYNKIKSR